MTRRTLTGLTLALIFAAAPPVPAAAAKRPCSEAGSKTITTSRYARVYRTTRGPRRGWVHGCLYSRGVRVALLNHDLADETLLLRPVLAGRFVGYALHWDGAETAGEEIRVTDLRRRKTNYLVLDPHERAGDPSASFGAMVVSPRGAVAWTWSTTYEIPPPGGTPPPGPEVRRLAWRPEEPRLGELLDSGPELDLKSLKRNGSAITWLKAGQPQMATLP